MLWFKTTHFASADGDLGCFLVLGTLNAYPVAVEFISVIKIGVIILTAQIVDLAIEDINVARSGIDPDTAGTFAGVRCTEIKVGELDIFDDDILCSDGKKVAVFHALVSADLGLAFALQRDAVLLDRKLLLVASALILDHDRGSFLRSIDGGLDRLILAGRNCDRLLVVCRPAAGVSISLTV